MGNKLQTQDRLIAATRDLIISQGVEGCSIETICSHAGYSRGAFYSNFGTKDSLLGMLAEEEYDGLIAALQAKVAQWATVDVEGGSHAILEHLLYDALETIGIDRALYILHSDLLIRSIRDPKWGARLLELNREFIEQLGRVLEAILEAAGRKPCVPLRALTHSVIGIAMRAAGIAAWYAALEEYTSSTPLPPLHDPAASKSSVRDILSMILVLLYGSSTAIDDAPPSQS